MLNIADGMELIEFYVFGTGWRPPMAGAKRRQLEGRRPTPKFLLD